jgi:uncharacterized FAD-dependent dehydrogenase
MIVEISCSPDEINDAALLDKKIRRAAKQSFVTYSLIRRWIDARGRPPRFRLRYQLWNDGDKKTTLNPGYQDVSQAAPVHIIGAGPAGYFAALECLANGLKPVVLEQGKDVQARRRDLKAIQQDGVVNPHSNYCFGEGGAGTYSDGKLYTRAKKRGDIDSILQILTAHGAKTDIEVDAHPHIGSNKLPIIIANIRQTIEQYGGEVHFGSEVTDILVEENSIKTLIINGKERVDSSRVILATGHSARSIYDMFIKKGWRIEAKPFALGLRIEHPQSLIDKIQYGQAPRHENLPAAEYRLACEINDRGVFSFCMCPGGLIVPAATAPGEIVVNGMSLSRRDSPFANSGLVVAIEPEDLIDDPASNPLVCLEFQRQIEQLIFAQGDGGQSAPAQRVVDFIAGHKSADLPKTSYIPGVFSCRLDLLLPDFIVARMRQGLKHFGRKMSNYLHPDAIVVGVESRTSAPLKIPRDPDTLEHPQIKGLYPCGEGAGYAGGIMSAAIDGQRVVRCIAAPK